MHTATYVEHPLTNSPPVTLLGKAFVHSDRVFCHQSDFKTKIPEIYPLYQFKGVLPKLHLDHISEICQNFCIESSQVKNRSGDTPMYSIAYVQKGYVVNNLINA